MILLRHEYPDAGVRELFKKASGTVNLTPQNVERAIRFIYENMQEELKEYFKLKCKVNCGVLIEAVHREVERRENGDKRKMFMCEM